MEMFFAKPRQDKIYLHLLKEIALAQRALFLCKFSWDKRVPYAQNSSKRSLFKRKPKESDPNQAKQEALGALKNKLIAHRRNQGYPSGLFWWNIPFEQVEQYLVYDIGEVNEDGLWRYERSWQTFEHSGIHTIMLKEEGHCADFSTHATYEVTQESKYSGSQRADMEKRFSQGLRDHDLYRLATSKGPVHSITTGIEYESYADYVLSSEYSTIRDIQRANYARSLYTEHHIDTLNIVSQSIHYEALYALADYNIDERGLLDFLGIHNFSFQGGKGDISQAIVQRYSSRDAAVVAAAYLADMPAVKVVPLALFGKNMTAAAADYNEAMRQAEIYTCLGEKISIEY